ncbi:MAG TPA: outer membrane protein transport protein, partial [Longimicrobiales bacterium]|nr:outer membrane protein transport protein [Longimicrobiales bacterium]
MTRATPGTLVVAAVLLWAAPLHGQGSSVYTQGACVSGRGGAAVATPCADASSIYYNPAAIAASPSAVSAGFSLIRNTGSFTYDSTGVVVDREPGTPIVPQLYASYRMGGRWAAGIGFFAPYGLGIQWPESFEGRFISRDTELQGLFLQPTVAWRAAPELSIGFGLDIVFGGLELNRSLDGPLENAQLMALGIPLGTDIARGKLSGSGVGLGGHLGIYYEPSDRFAVGARYMHSVRLDLEGDAEFDQVATGRTVIIPDPETGEPTPVPLDALVAPQFGPGAPLSDQDVSAELTLPAQAVLGIRIGVTPDLDLSADYQWTGWSSFDRIVAEFEFAPDLPLELEYEDTHGIRVGTEYRATRALDLRAGFVYNTAAS